MKANINGIVQDYKPRLDSEKPKSIPLKTAGECLSALKNYGDDEEIRDAATRKLWMMLKEQHEEPAQKEERVTKLSSWYDNLQKCIDYIEQHGNDEIERGKAIERARELIESTDKTICEIETLTKKLETLTSDVRHVVGYFPA